jgi:CheY-like chemotaxis protein
MGCKTILIVEDNFYNMELVCDLLENAGYPVLKATDAAKAIEIARKNVPNLILMDINLPGMDGLTATGILKKDDITKDIPIVALTAHSMKGDKEKAINAGCDAYIAKPIDTRAFVSLIESYCEI